METGVEKVHARHRKSLYCVERAKTRLEMAETATSRGELKSSSAQFKVEPPPTESEWEYWAIHESADAWRLCDTLEGDLDVEYQDLERELEKKRKGKSEHESHADCPTEDGS